MSETAVRDMSTMLAAQYGVEFEPPVVLPPVPRPKKLEPRSVSPKANSPVSSPVPATKGGGETDRYSQRLGHSFGENLRVAAGSG